MDAPPAPSGAGAASLQRAAHSSGGVVRAPTPTPIPMQDEQGGHANHAEYIRLGR